MTTLTFPTLFQPLTIRGKKIKNRIMSTGHDTVLPEDGLVSDALVAYHQARVKGGVGLIVLQVSGVHETARYSSHLLMATEEKCVPGYRRVAEMCHAEGCTLFAQLFHPGREIMETADGLAPVAYAPSSVPNGRFHVMPRTLDRDMILEIIDGYAAAAERMYRAGIDGVEVVASHGYLPSQFLNPHTNRRDDEYGGELKNRQRFLRDTLAAIRARTGEDFIIGMRISANEIDDQGLDEETALATTLEMEPLLDYVSITAGTSDSLQGAVHIVPPMTVKNAYLADYGSQYKQRLNIPVFVTGRINQPQEAEKLIAGGQADICGMTRAMISDPEMVNKAYAGRIDDIRACIACNQACIGHFHRGIPISCIQHPETGRELQYGEIRPAAIKRKVLVAGGGPAGMKAAAIAAQRGHDVTLCEAGARLGGQTLLAQLVPGRSEFGGIVTNFSRELSLTGVKIECNQTVDAALVRERKPDVVIVATGAVPYWPDFDRDGGMQVIDSWALLQGKVQAGHSVLVADAKADWIGIGVAELLARSGAHVQFSVDGRHPGETLQYYVQDHSIARLLKLGIEFLPHTRLYGCSEDTVFLEDVLSGEPVVVEDIDTLVLCQGHQSVDTLADALSGIVETHRIGDCLAPRTAEEAVFDGLRIACAI